MISCVVGLTTVFFQNVINSIFISSLFEIEIFEQASQSALESPKRKKSKEKKKKKIRCLREFSGDITDISSAIEQSRARNVIKEDDAPGAFTLKKQMGYSNRITSFVLLPSLFIKNETSMAVDKAILIYTRLGGDLMGYIYTETHC